jgi:hypothetical protein
MVCSVCCAVIAVAAVFAWGSLFCMLLMQASSADSRVFKEVGRGTRCVDLSTLCFASFWMFSS